MLACLRCCLFFAQLIIVAFAEESYIGGFATFRCIPERAMEGCNKTGQAKCLSDEEVGIFLFTEKNTEEAEFLHKCGGRLPSNTNFDRTKKLKIILSGYLGYVCAAAYMREMMYQLICRDGSNVIIYDWMHELGERLDYAKSIQLIPHLCNILVCVLENIMNETGIKGEDIHIIAHSLGAPIAGCIGQKLKNAGKQIGWITGLDPAGPGFHNASMDKVLDRSDASRVQIIHTNYGECLPDFGMCKPLGHADFYIDKKDLCKRCFLQPTISLLKKDFIFGMASLFPQLCAHIIAANIFIATINPCGCEIYGKKCDSIKDCKPTGCNSSDEAIMGFNWKDSYGIYHVNIDILCPYCEKTYRPKNMSDSSSSHCCPNGKKSA